MAYQMHPVDGLIIHKSPRVGQYGKVFYMYKFRTEKVDAWKEFPEIGDASDGDNGNIVSPDEYFDLKNSLDKKFSSAFGYFLRQTRIDEIPQVVNILKGEMVPIGLRPLMEKEYELFPEEHMKRREQYLPGAIPIERLFNTNNGDIADVVRREERYLDMYDKDPMRTNIIYLVDILKNVGYHLVRPKEPDMASGRGNIIKINEGLIDDGTEPRELRRSG